MNCKDIARILDEQELDDLSPSQSRELKAHVAGCDDCAGQCLVSDCLADFRSDVPQMPQMLHERAAQLQDICKVRVRQGSSRRPLIIGSLFLLGTAATMFALLPGHQDRAPT